MNITVIGGSGFLGSHVADQLSMSGHQVRIFDMKISPWLRPDQEMIVGDLLNLEDLEGAIKGSDIVYHFAALADLNKALNKPIETVKINVLGTVQILELCRKYGIKRFMYASTVYVYSREGGFYRCSKQSSEHYIEEYSRVYGLDYTILRYGSLFGPRSDESNGLFRIVRDAIKTGELRISKVSPEAIREYIHVEDAAKASVVALGEDFKNESIVLTGHEPMSVIDFMRMLAEILGFSNQVEFIDSEKSGHYVRTPYAYQPKLGRKYTPPLHVDLGQGLIQLINEVSLSLSKEDHQKL
jgi:UDP-glucose 4-epimerase